MYRLFRKLLKAKFFYLRTLVLLITILVSCSSPEYKLEDILSFEELVNGIQEKDKFYKKLTEFGFVLISKNDEGSFKQVQYGYGKDLSDIIINQNTNFSDDLKTILISGVVVICSSPEYWEIYEKICKHIDSSCKYIDTKTDDNSLRQLTWSIFEHPDGYEVLTTVRNDKTQNKIDKIITIAFKTDK